jgi:hypothetical protein
MTKTLAVATVIVSVPLLLSFNIKYQLFPEGLPYALLYFGGLLSVYLTPVFLISGLIVRARILRSPDISKEASLRWNLVGVIIAVIAELVFIAARYSPP